MDQDDVPDIRVERAKRFRGEFQPEVFYDTEHRTYLYVRDGVIMQTWKPLKDGAYQIEYPFCLFEMKPNYTQVTIASAGHTKEGK